MYLPWALVKAKLFVSCLRKDGHSNYVDGKVMVVLNMWCRLRRWWYLRDILHLNSSLSLLPQATWVLQTVAGRASNKWRRAGRLLLFSVTWPQKSSLVAAVKVATTTPSLITQWYNSCWVRFLPTAL
jgi:hypothetical protein